MWKDFEAKVVEYEDKLREKFQNNEKYCTLTSREIDEKIRKSVNQKFREESNIVLSTHVYGILSGLWSRDE